MFSIGNDELDASPDLNIGDAILCPHCRGSHIVEGGTSDGEKSNLLLFYKCGETPYLAGVAGKNVMRRFLKQERR